MGEVEEMHIHRRRNTTAMTEGVEEPLPEEEEEEVEEVEEVQCRDLPQQMV
jgi:uncharacterized protein YrzB (UPF0473 family)